MVQYLGFSYFNHSGSANKWCGVVGAIHNTYVIYIIYYFLSAFTFTECWYSSKIISVLNCHGFAVAIFGRCRLSPFSGQRFSRYSHVRCFLLCTLHNAVRACMCVSVYTSMMFPEIRQISVFVCAVGVFFVVCSFIFGVPCARTIDLLSLNLMRHSIVDLRFSATDTDTYLHACSARTLAGYSVRMKNEQHFLSSQLAQSTHSCYSSHSKYTHISVLRKLERNGMEHNGFFSSSIRPWQICKRKHNLLWAKEHIASRHSISGNRGRERLFAEYGSVSMPSLRAVYFEICPDGPSSDTYFWRSKFSNKIWDKRYAIVNNV